MPAARCGKFTFLPKVCFAAVCASQPLMAHQAGTESAAPASAPAGGLSDVGADMAARLQRIEALAAEIARAQVRAQHHQNQSRHDQHGRAIWYPGMVQVTVLEICCGSPLSH